MAHLQQIDFCNRVKQKHSDFFLNKLVLDIGSLDINGNNQRFFEDCQYLGVDVGEGRNVDIVAKAHELGFPCPTFDTIISTECFEHDRYFGRSLQKIIQLLKDGGLFLFSCATTGRAEHGTARTSPADAPLLQKLGKWCNYYRNLTEADIRSKINIDEYFQSYEFAVGTESHDLYFWGLKKGKFIPRSDYSFQMNRPSLHAAIAMSKELAAQQNAVNDRDRQLQIRENDFSALKMSVSVLQQNLAESEERAAALTQSRDEHVVRLGQTVAERENQIAGLSQTIVERDGQIASLGQTVSGRDNLIADLNQTIVERDGQIASLGQTVSGRENHIAVQHQELIKREERIADISIRLEAKQNAHIQLEKDNAQRENALLTNSNEALRSIEKLVREKSKSDDEHEMRIQSLTHQAEQDKLQQARDFSSREKALRQAQAEQERIFLLQIDVERKITLDLEQELRRSERVFQDEITGLRLEIERQKHANQLQAQQYNFDVSAAKTERESALQARNKIGARVFAMQQENDQLSRELAEIHEGLARMQGTISWRLLTPLRKLGVLGIPLPSVPNRRVAIGYDTPPSRQISDQLRTNYVHLEDANLYLGKNLESASVADSLETELTAADVAVNANADASSHAMVTNYEGLVQFEGRQFVEIAYLTLLKRQPDIDGLSFYLGRIQDGVTKLQILHEIFFSTECRGIGSELPGLQEAFSQEEAIQ